MQAQKRNSRTGLTIGFIVVVLFGTLVARFDEGSLFEIKIAKARSKGVDKVSPVEGSIPFFEAGTLSPTWEKSPSRISLPKFSLIDQTSAARTEAIFNGRKTVMAFFFTSCQGFCPGLVQTLKRIESSVPQDKNIQFVLFSVDPDNDNPEKLREFATKRKIKTGQNWTLLTGDKETIYRLARVTLTSEAYQKVSVPNKMIHPEQLYVIDEEGRLRGIFNGTSTDAAKNTSRVLRDLK